MDARHSEIVIIEEDEQIIDALKLLLNQFSHFQILNVYPHHHTALKTLHKNLPDILIYSLQDSLESLQGIKEIHKKYSQIKILVLSALDDKDTVFQAFHFGASGYILKNHHYTELLDALELISEGGAPMSPSIAKMLVSSFQKNTNSPLTERETEVLSLLAIGQSYAMIADTLFITKETIKTHIKHIYHKLQVKSKAEAIAIALKEKYI
ncbi:response regulator transcription factor [Rapidithrix thailandica]|uniref:Response regulator transcription factor n=1 Tax=Rapidithrix thailandica TaxID=413964 RepID=A0AAW9S5G6_9BACT